MFHVRWDLGGTTGDVRRARRALAVTCLLAMAFSCDTRTESPASSAVALGTGGVDTNAGLSGSGGGVDTNAGLSGSGGGVALATNGTGGLPGNAEQAANIDSGIAAAGALNHSPDHDASVGQQPAVASDAGAPPLVLCAPAAPDGSIVTQGTSSDSGVSPRDDSCAPPPSRCLDHDQLVYYTGGTCQSGRCAWVAQIMMCPGACFGSGCDVGFTA